MSDKSHQDVENLIIFFIKAIQNSAGSDKTSISKKYLKDIDVPILENILMNSIKNKDDVKCAFKRYDMKHHDQDDQMKKNILLQAIGTNIWNCNNYNCNDGSKICNIILEYENSKQNIKTVIFNILKVIIPRGDVRLLISQTKLDIPTKISTSSRINRSNTNTPSMKSKTPPSTKTVHIKFIIAKDFTKANLGLTFSSQKMPVDSYNPPYIYSRFNNNNTLQIFVKHPVARTVKHQNQFKWIKKYNIVLDKSILTILGGYKGFECDVTTYSIDKNIFITKMDNFTFSKNISVKSIEELDESPRYMQVAGSKKSKTLYTCALKNNIIACAYA